MAQNTTTIYANVINVRVTPGEFVLEFGAHFPDNPKQGPPSDYRPEVRVVMARGLLPGIVNILSQVQQQQQQKAQASQPKVPPGFSSGAKKDQP